MKTILIFAISTFFILTSCNSDIKFDKTKWLQVDDLGQYPYRQAMLNDLTSNHKLKGLSYKQLTDLIGEQQKNLIGDSSEIYYSILTDYGSDIDPVHTIALAFKLDKDSTVTEYRIDEWEK